MRRTAQRNSHHAAALAGRASHVGHEPLPLEQQIMHTPQSVAQHRKITVSQTIFQTIDRIAQIREFSPARY